MSLITEVFYGIKCNRCGKICDDGEHAFWNDESGAEENAMDSDWLSENGKHHCPNCFEYDEEQDKNLIYQDYPQHLKDLNKFLKTISGYSHETKEGDAFFMVSKNMHNRTQLAEFEEAYIKAILGDNLISIEYAKHERYTRYETVITVKK